MPYSRILALNKPEWLYVLLGVIAAAVSGGVHPAFAVIFGKIIGVSFCKWAAILNFIHAQPVLCTQGWMGLACVSLLLPKLSQMSNSM